MSKFQYKFKREGLIILDVLLKAKRRITVRMVIDTGATYTLIPWKIIQALGIDPRKVKERIFIVTASTTEKVLVVKVPSLFVLGKEIKNVRAVIHDLPPASRVDGLLGLNVLYALGLKIDFSKKIIEFN
jgi:aspartyl protease family protein